MGEGSGPDRTMTSRFARAAQSAGVIRSWLRERLSAARVPPDVVDVAELLVSEVVTNAVEYGEGNEIIVRVATDGDVEMAVHDQGATGAPHLHEATPDDVRGRGLAMVQALATSWGTRRSESGKWVWFRLSPGPGPRRRGPGVTHPVNGHVPGPTG